MGMYISRVMHHALKELRHIFRSPSLHLVAVIISFYVEVFGLFDPVSKGILTFRRIQRGLLGSSLQR